MLHWFPCLLLEYQFSLFLICLWVDVASVEARVKCVVYKQCINEEAKKKTTKSEEDENHAAMHAFTIRSENTCMHSALYILLARRAKNIS